MNLVNFKTRFTGIYRIFSKNWNTTNLIFSFSICWLWCKRNNFTFFNLLGYKTSRCISFMYSQDGITNIVLKYFVYFVKKPEIWNLFPLNPLTKRRHNRKNKEKRFISIEKYVYTAIIGKYGKDKNSYVCLITLFWC